MINDPQSFCYWLQGYSELCGERPSEIQWEMIKEHLQLVFKKETKLNVNMSYCGNLKFDGVDIPSQFSPPEDYKNSWSIASNFKSFESDFPLVTGIEEFQKYNFSGNISQTGMVNVEPLVLNKMYITC